MKPISLGVLAIKARLSSQASRRGRLLVFADDLFRGPRQAFLVAGMIFFRAGVIAAASIREKTGWPEKMISPRQLPSAIRPPYFVGKRKFNQAK